MQFQTGNQILKLCKFTNSQSVSMTNGGDTHTVLSVIVFWSIPQRKNTTQIEQPKENKGTEGRATALYYSNSCSPNPKPNLLHIPSTWLYCSILFQVLVTSLLNPASVLGSQTILRQRKSGCTILKLVHNYEIVTWIRNWCAISNLCNAFSKSRKFTNCTEHIYNFPSADSRGSAYIVSFLAWHFGCLLVPLLPIEFFSF